MAHKLGLLVFVFLAGLLTACGQNEMVEDVVLITVTAVSPTTISPTQKPSATATTIPTTTPTQTPAASATATTIPTLTPLPTFAPDELETAVADLLANPMNCDVPCWWGAIPGKTTIDEIKHSLAPYNFDISEYEYEDNGKPISVLILGIGHDEESNDFNIRMGYGFTNSSLFDVLAYSSSVFEILAKYGQPDEIWLETMSFKREDLPTRLNLVYLQKGMAVGYVVDGDIQDENVIACFTDEETGRVRLLAPNTAISYKDFPTIFEKDRRYLPLEEATDLTIAEFMEQFSDPTKPQCLETPTELWD